VNVFRKNGFTNTFSCDLLPTSGGHPEYHLQCDVKDILCHKWDMILAFPPCTHICASGARWFEQKRKDGRQQAGIDFFMQFTRLDCPKVAIENPVGIMSTVYRKPDQIVQPWQFGHPEKKATCFWLKGLPLLKPTKIIEAGKRKQRIWKMPETKDRSRLRSKTYDGIAAAMVEQWGYEKTKKAAQD